MAATEQELGDLHKEVTDALRESVRNKETRTAADIANAIRFLKENSISCVADKDNHVGQLAKDMAAACPTALADDPELQEALSGVVNMQDWVANGR